MSTPRARQRDNNRWHSAPDCYTPQWLIDRIAAFLGAGYFDPCPARYGRPLEVNGLAIPWRGKVFCNPPYGAAIVPWIAKAMTEPVDEIIMLVPAYTETRWFAPLFAHPMCFVFKRLRFYRFERGDTVVAPHPSVLVYRGPRARAFADAFADIGPIMRPYHAALSCGPIARISLAPQRFGASPHSPHIPPPLAPANNSVVS